MDKKCRFLLIGYTQDDPWYEMIERVIKPLGKLNAIKEDDTLHHIRQQNFDIIIIDTVNVENVFDLLSSIKSEKPGAKIIVATGAPTWQRARDVIQAGAKDYFRRSLVESESRAAITKLLC